MAKLGSVMTGDTLGDQGKPITLAGVDFPGSSYSTSVHPKTKTDLDKMGPALQRLVEEDPTLRLSRDPSSGETILSGLGEPHVQIALDRMSRRFGVNVELGLPRVPYRETISAKTIAEYKHKKQTGGAGQYGHVFLELEPLPDSEFEFGEKVFGGSVPRNFYPAVEKGVREGLESGPVAGFPVVNVKVTLTDGSYHAVDSNEMSFKIASKEAFKKGILQGKPVLLEPIMTLRVTVPETYTGDVMSDLNTKRAHVSGMNPGANGTTTIEATVPGRRGAALRHRPALDHPGTGIVHDRVFPLPAGPGAHRRPGQSRGREAGRSELTRDPRRREAIADRAAAGHRPGGALPSRADRPRARAAKRTGRPGAGDPRVQRGRARACPCSRQAPFPAPTTRLSSTAGRWAIPVKGYGSYEIAGPDGTVAARQVQFGNDMTNNQAEFRAVIAAPGRSAGAGRPAGRRALGRGPRRQSARHPRAHAESGASNTPGCSRCTGRLPICCDSLEASTWPGTRGENRCAHSGIDIPATRVRTDRTRKRGSGTSSALSGRC